MSVSLELRLGAHGDTVANRLVAWGDEEILERVWSRDHTVWVEEPVPELTNRLGWLDLPQRLAGLIPDLEDFAAGLRRDDIRDVVVLGMGGSSLAPEVFATTFGSAPGFPELRVLDSTHPSAVISLASQIDVARTVFIVASKSGTTIEPLSFMEYFWNLVEAGSDEPGQHFVATTDPGSQLEELAQTRQFRRIFLAPAEVGGRYSALTEFGMVPAAAIGLDLHAMQGAARVAQEDHAAQSIVATAAGCRLGAALGELAAAGRDKVTFVTSSDLAALPAWIEQLIAESTGKDGKGIVPIAGERLGPLDVYGDDRFFVSIATASEAIDPAQFGDHPYATIVLDDLADIGAVMYIFEMATALAGQVIGIQPFDQPDVQLAKELARDAMGGNLDTSGVEEIDALNPELKTLVAEWLEQANPGDYVGINAFLEPTKEHREILDAARIAVRDGTRLATTLDFGPRFLHSTGQLHKGGPDIGVFLEVIDHPQIELAVPTADYGFAELVSAQALGDYSALRQRGRRAMLVCVGDAGLEGLQLVTEAVTRASMS